MALKKRTKKLNSMDKEEITLPIIEDKKSVNNKKVKKRKEKYTLISTAREPVPRVSNPDNKSELAIPGMETLFKSGYCLGAEMLKHLPASGRKIIPKEELAKMKDDYAKKQIAQEEFEQKERLKELERKNT